LTGKKKVYIETYGCQMNFSDSEIIASIMKESGFETVTDVLQADVIFVNTCSIRDNAEQRVKRRLRALKSLRKKNPSLIIGVLGCMAERLKTQLLDEEAAADLVAGPDAYRHLPQLLATAEGGQKAIDIILSEEETYADIKPDRIDSNGVSAFISIMRGCQNHCAYCVVPFTRGKERSRSPQTIIDEAYQMFNAGFREVTLLGQNVNSYFWDQNGLTTNFSQLLELIAQIHPMLRVRFATSHPKDLSDELLQTMARYQNICKSIHLPVQSGNNRILHLMNRKYTREWYIDRIEAIRQFLPECGISTDIITGFCTETEADHNDTLSLMEWARYDFAFMFKYSERPDTLAALKLKDDVPDLIKSRRLEEIIHRQQMLSYQSNIRDVGKTFTVLVEGRSKKSSDHIMGRTSYNKVVVFPGKSHNPGEYVDVRITKCTTATLIGEAVTS
jgi:tRNA-2-methylthio-N6-dimethylallyladenosine synthase